MMFLSFYLKAEQKDWTLGYRVSEWSSIRTKGTYRYLQKESEPILFFTKITSGILYFLASKAAICPVFIANAIEIERMISV